MQPSSPRRQVISWCFYDWANTAYSGLMITFIFPALFQKFYAPDPVMGQSLWGYAMAASAVLAALLAPLLGRYMDRRGSPLFYVTAFTALYAFLTLAVGILPVSQDSLYAVIALIVAATCAYELAFIAYNAILPQIAAPEKLGRISGYGWALGYLGGLLSLGLSLWLITGRDGQSLPALIAIQTALWTAVFALPLAMTKFAPTARRAAMPGAPGVVASYKNIFARHKGLGRFLIAYLLFTDGLATLFAFVGIYMAGMFDLPPQKVLIYAILMQLAAGLGAFGFAKIDDIWGSAKVIKLSLIALACFSLIGVAVAKLWWFVAFACCAAVFVGPVQSSARSHIARIAGEDDRAQLFSLMTFSGKATAFLGPFIVAAITHASGSQQMGMLPVCLFFVAAFFILSQKKLREPKH